MSLRAQSLLNLKMYKLNRHVLKDLQKQINEVLVKSNNDEETQQVWYIDTNNNIIEFVIKV